MSRIASVASVVSVVPLRLGEFVTMLQYLVCIGCNFDDFVIQSTDDWNIALSAAETQELKVPEDILSAYGRDSRSCCGIIQ